jgi:hypothetical protein
MDMRAENNMAVTKRVAQKVQRGVWLASLMLALSGGG